MAEQKRGFEKTLSRIVIWLPTLAIILFYIPSTLDKLINHDQNGKVVESSAVMITAGVFILI